MVIIMHTKEWLRRRRYARGSRAQQRFLLFVFVRRPFVLYNNNNNNNNDDDDDDDDDDNHNNNNNNNPFI